MFAKGGRPGKVPEKAQDARHLRRERNVRHIKAISKATPKSANVVQDLLCEVLIIMSSLLTSKTVNIPILNALGGEDGKCQPMPVESI